ncbi:MAG: hypothetical protein ACLTQI_07175 [Slackia sp.]
MALFNKRISARINSSTLMATAADSLNDVIATAAVLAATLASDSSASTSTAGRASP